LPVSADILFYGSINAGEIDLVFSFLIFLQLICIFHYSEQQKWLQLYLFSYSILAASILTKGYPALLFQAITLPSWFMYNKQFKKLFCWQHLLGIVLGCGIVALYFLLMQKSNVLVYCLLLLNDASQKTFLSSSWGAVLLNIVQSPLQLLYITLPGSLCFFVFLIKTSGRILKNKLFSFSVLVIAVNIPVYIVTSYTPNRYLYPLFPFIAIAAAYIFYTAASAKLFSKFKLSYSFALKVIILMAALRMVYNVWGINAQVKLSHHLIYRNLGSSIVAITKDKPIYITGEPYRLPLLNSLPLVSYEKDSVMLPPLIAHQIPYYISLHTNASVQYHLHPRKKFFYIAPISFIQGKKVRVYKRFFDYWQNRELALVVFL